MLFVVLKIRKKKKCFLCRFFNDDKCVYLKFIATEHTERIETKLKGIHYVSCG